MNISTNFQNIGKGSMYLTMDDFVIFINRPSAAEALFGIETVKIDLCEHLPVMCSCNLLGHPPTCGP